MKEQMYIVVAWRIDAADATARAMQHGKVEVHVGNNMLPELTPREMNEIAYAAKMKFAQIARRRKNLYRKGDIES